MSRRSRPARPSLAGPDDCAGRHRRRRTGRGRRRCRLRARTRRRRCRGGRRCCAACRSHGPNAVVRRNRPRWRLPPGPSPAPPMSRRTALPHRGRASPPAEAAWPKPLYQLNPPGGRSRRGAEPILIEVWRPHRTNHHSHSADPSAAARVKSTDAGLRSRVSSRYRPTAPSPGDATTAGPSLAPTIAEPTDDPMRPDRGPPNRDRRPATAQAETGEARPLDGEATIPNAGRPRVDGRRDGPRRNDQRGEGHRGDRQRGEQHRGDGQRREGGRGDGHRSDSNRPQQFSSERAPPRERQPDPNSPFAKLMALKLELERGKKES